MADTHNMPGHAKTVTVIALCWLLVVGVVADGTKQPHHHHHEQHVMDATAQMPHIDTILSPPPVKQSQQQQSQQPKQQPQTPKINFDNLKLTPQQQEDLVNMYAAHVGHGPATKPERPPAYHDIFPSLHYQPEGARQHAIYRERPKTNTKNKKKNTNSKGEEYSPVQAGLPAIVVAELDEKWVRDHNAVTFGSTSGKINNPISGEADLGETACHRLSFAMQRETDIPVESVHWLKARTACMFQVLMDENADDVVEWLLEQPMVRVVEGNSPLDSIANQRWV